jgi:hypothetical protein
VKAAQRDVIRTMPLLCTNKIVNKTRNELGPQEFCTSPISHISSLLLSDYAINNDVV